MTKIITISKKRLMIYVALILVLPFAAVLMINGIQNKNIRGTITNMEAARMLGLAIMEQPPEPNQTLDADYYVNIVNESGCCIIKDGQAQVTYKLLQDVIAFYVGEVPEDIRNIRGSKIISRKQFMEEYIKIIPYLPYGAELQMIELDIAGLEKQEQSADETASHNGLLQLYHIYTGEGIYYELTNNMQLKENHTCKVMVRGHNIIYEDTVLDQEVFFENVLVKSCADKTITIDLYGCIRAFQVKGLNEELNDVLCDVKLSEGRIIQIDLKTDTITGKVLSVTQEYVDIEGYGRVELDDGFIMYDTFDYNITKDETGIIVGYSLQDFIVARGKICGAIISHRLSAVNIRVMIMTSGFQSLFHENVVITSSEGFSVNSDTESIHYNGGEEVSFNKDILGEKRVRIIPDGTNRLQVKTVNRSQGNPDYSGTIEVDAFEEGLVIVNDVNIEEYVSRVIPSEMPTSFGVDALKVQAVCARSYAYKELVNTAYSQYGAHVDDSIQYQVYNNTAYSHEAEEAALQTEGEVLMYGDEVVQTYYYSTSCGVTTDVSLWGTNTENYPYYRSVTVGSEMHENISSEDKFFEFITNTYETDYDSTFPLYRWNMTVDVDTMGASISAKSGQNIGKVTGITINRRISGGAAGNITVVGELGEITLSKESDIRTILGNGSVDLNTQSGPARYERLPSSFISIQPVYNEQGVLSAYTIYGGGYGHGIGMSQNAVKTMIQTMNYAEILTWFYPNTTIARME